MRLALGHKQRAANLLQQLALRGAPVERTPEQIEALDRALALWREMAGETAPEAVTIRTEIALTHLAQKRTAEAQRWIAELLPIASLQSDYRRERILDAAAQLGLEDPDR